MSTDLKKAARWYYRTVVDDTSSVGGQLRLFSRRLLALALVGIAVAVCVLAVIAAYQSHLTDSDMAPLALGITVTVGVLGVVAIIAARDRGIHA